MNHYTRWSDRYTEQYIKDKIAYYDRQLKYFDYEYKDKRNHLALRARWKNKLKLFYEKNPMHGYIIENINEFQKGFMKE